MNREERRDMRKNGASQENVELLQKYDQPCKVIEVVKISKSIAEDVVDSAIDEYRRMSTSTIVALTLQLEILRDSVIKSGIITEEKFKSMYESAAKEFEEKQREYLESIRKSNLETPDSIPGVVGAEQKANPVEVKIVKEDGE